MDRLVRYLIFVSLITFISGCGATHTAVNKRNLDAQTQMSSTIFLDPVTAENKRSIFLQIRNTSDKPELDLQDSIALALQEKGYQITVRPEDAHYVLQANVLQVARCDLRAAQHALTQGFGATVSGAAIGAGIGSLIKTPGRKGKNKEAVVAGSLVGGAVATVTDAMVQDVVYTAIADIQISERIGNSISVKEKTKSKLKQGNHGARELTSTETVEWKRFQTRVVATANQVNLKFEKAAPELLQGMTRSIAGIF
jgi:hypothetical protein